MAERTPLIFTPGYGLGYYISREKPPWDTHWNGTYISASHNRVMDVFLQAGYEPHFYQPNWREPDPRTWAVDLATYATSLAQNKSVSLAGFSVGGAISLQTAELLEQSKIPVEGVIAASASPFFGKKWLGRARTNPTSGIPDMPISQQHVYNNLEIPRVTTTPVQLYVGTRETNDAREFHEQLLFEYPQSVSIKPPCAHNILDESYVEALRQNAGKLRSQQQGS